MLVKLLSSLRPSLDQQVISLIGDGVHGAHLRALGIDVHCLPDDRRMDLIRLRDLLGRLRPDLVQTWLVRADLLGGLAGIGRPAVPVVWNIRNDNPGVNPPRPLRRMFFRGMGLLSHRLPAAIVCVSTSALATYAQSGYCRRKMIVIPNGFDLARFRPDPSLRAQVRRDLGLGEADRVIVLVARYHPQKDHATALRAFARLCERIADARLVLIGSGLEEGNAELVGMLQSLGVTARVRLLGSRNDVERYYNAADIGTLTSAYGEGFPNVLGEAMACALPCVVTDSGDSVSIVGDTGIAVPVRSPELIADAWQRLLELEPDVRQALGLRARARVVGEFSMDRAARRYERLYQTLIDGGALADLDDRSC